MTTDSLTHQFGHAGHGDWRFPHCKVGQGTIGRRPCRARTGLSPPGAWDKRREPARAGIGFGRSLPPARLQPNGPRRHRGARIPSGPKQPRTRRRRDPQLVRRHALHTSTSRRRRPFAADRCHQPRSRPRRRCGDRQSPQRPAGRTRLLSPIDGEQAVPTGTGLVATITGERFAARDPGYATKAWRAGLQGWHKFGRSTLFVGVEVGGLRADQRLMLFPAARSDHYRGASVGVVMRQLARGGPAPFVRLNYERNRSTIAFYDYRRLRTEFGLTRTF